MSVDDGAGDWMDHLEMVTEDTEEGEKAGGDITEGEDAGKADIVMTEYRPVRTYHQYSEYGDDSGCELLLLH